MRISARQNPHFYLELPDDASSYGSNFHLESLKDFSSGLENGTTIYVLIDKSSRLFLDAAEPHIPRIFGNLWKPDQTIILKGDYSPRRIVHSNSREFKMFAAVWNRKTSSLAEWGRSKTTGIAPLSLIRLRAVLDHITRTTTAKLSRNRLEAGVIW